MAQVDALGYFASTDVKPVLNTITSKQYEIYGFSQHLDKFSVRSGPRPALLENAALGDATAIDLLTHSCGPTLSSRDMADGFVTAPMLPKTSEFASPGTTEEESGNGAPRAPDATAEAVG